MENWQMSIRIEGKGLDRVFANLEKQVRFAAAKALTLTAQAAQAEVKRQLPERFTIRTNWVPNGIRIRPANTSTLSASVLVMNRFMALQETGGDKTSPFGEALGVPVGARPTPQSVTRPSKFPGALLKDKKFFIGIPKGRNVKPGVWKRLGRKGRANLKLMYVLEQSVQIKPRFGFQDTVMKVAMEQFQMMFSDELRQALAAAR